MQALPFGGDDRRDGVIGLAFAMRHVAQLLLMCDRGDIGVSIDGGSLEKVTRTGGKGGVPDALQAEPNIFIYDNYPGGIGFSQPLFAMHADLLRRTRDVIAGCECEHGCPTCVGPVGNTGPLAKLVALRILDRLAQLSLQGTAPAPALDAPVPGITAVLEPPPAHSLAEPPPF
jgi:DEAD/DEAH box helicase domain-containing protein